MHASEEETEKDRRWASLGKTRTRDDEFQASEGRRNEPRRRCREYGSRTGLDEESGNWTVDRTRGLRGQQPERVGEHQRVNPGRARNEGASTLVSMSKTSGTGEARERLRRCGDCESDDAWTTRLRRWECCGTRSLLSTSIHRPFCTLSLITYERDNIRGLCKDDSSTMKTHRSAYAPSLRPSFPLRASTGALGLRPSTVRPLLCPLGRALLHLFARRTHTPGASILSAVAAPPHSIRSKSIDRSLSLANRSEHLPFTHPPVGGQPVHHYSASLPLIAAAHTYVPTILASSSVLLPSMVPRASKTTPNSFLVHLS
ncbi:hypothetical protein BDN70DRAFT_922489 [Pholiota conissans]|uniref:Uncharacterized protein n=1 Tax=Pholiota conissans TaxID=109636 RepID=A0A9P6CSR9_9AGAR|nr:hypothetical protein BDN70DRAFT_922489 [Pholiota conissans]